MLRKLALLFFVYVFMDVHLRALEPKDIDNIYNWENDVDQWSVGINNRFISKYDIENYVLTAQLQDVFSAQQVRFIIDMEDEFINASVGCVDLFDIDVKNLRASIGLYICSKYRGKGIAFKAIELIEKYACDTLCFNQLYVLVPCKNIPSVRLFEKTGYNIVGSLQQWIRRKENFEDVFLYQKIL